MRTIDRDTLKRKMDAGEDFKLIEVLPESSFDDFHLPGAINVPLSAEDFDDKVQSAAGKDEQVIVYCKDTACDASPKAARRMEQLGFADVLDYEAGKDDWRAASLPVA